MTARYLTKTTPAQYWSRADLLGITDYPFTMATFYTHDAPLDLQIMMAFAHSGGTDGYHHGIRSVSELNSFIIADWAPDPAPSNVSAMSQTLVGGAYENSSIFTIGVGSPPVAGEWHHCGGVYTSSTSRHVYYDGNVGAEGTQDLAFVAASMNVSEYIKSSLTLYFIIYPLLITYI